MISQSLDFSQSLDNKTSFIPLEKEDIKKNKIENKIENIKSIIYLNYIIIIKFWYEILIQIMIIMK